MNRKSKIYVLVLIWGAILIQLFINSSINREEKLIEQVMSQGVNNVVEGSVRAYAYYGDDKLTIQSKRQIAVRLAKELGIVSGYTLEDKIEDESELTVLKKEGQQGDTCIRVVSMNNQDKYGQNITENYIMIEILLKGESGLAAYEYKEKLADIYKNLGMTPNTNVYICSQEKGKLTESERDVFTNEFLESMDAVLVSDANFEDITCVYGYSRNIDEFVYQDNQRVNVNIAFTYDEDDDVTYIHRAVPFIDKSF